MSAQRPALASTPRLNDSGIQESSDSTISLRISARCLSGNGNSDSSSFSCFRSSNISNLFERNFREEGQILSVMLHRRVYKWELLCEPMYLARICLLAHKCFMTKPKSIARTRQLKIELLDPVQVMPISKKPESVSVTGLRSDPMNSGTPGHVTMFAIVTVVGEVGVAVLAHWIYDHFKQHRPKRTRVESEEIEFKEGEIEKIIRKKWDIKED